MSINSENPFAADDVVELCHCTDGNFAPIVVVKSENNKFALYGLSNVIDMGLQRNNKITNDDYDAVVNYSSYSGVAHIAICKNNKWGLIEFWNSYQSNVGYEWKLLAEIKHTKDEVEAIRAKRLANDFDAIDWLKKFRKASAARAGYRELRAEIFQQTVKFAKKGFYFVNNTEVNIFGRNYSDATFFYDKELKLAPNPAVYETQYSVIEADCLETAHLLQQAGYKVCVLNMASRQNPGGGVVKGSGAQEENLFRRTDLYRSMYRFADYAAQYDIARHAKSYPLDRNYGGIYSEGIIVFRGSERSGYSLLKQPYTMNVVSVAALSAPELKQTDKGYRLIDTLVEPTKNKIRTILRIAATHNNDCVVLSAFGCGAFNNPPEHIAEIFREVFLEDEFNGRFKMIVFAIIDDHNSWKEHNPEGNVIPFMKVFSVI
jgi:uncharacterized protein (TIGR02452 family)